jgi:hypothetical protein
MTVTGSSSVGRVPRAATRHESGPARTAIVMALALVLDSSLGFAGETALTLRAARAGHDGPQARLTIELFRWSTDTERAPLLTAIAAPPPAPPAAPAAAGRGGRAAQAGRGARGGRGGAAVTSPMDRLAAAVKGAPTLGFVWSDGVTGYSIKYAWRTPAAGAPERIVLITDRRLGANAPGWAPASGPLADADFTVLEIRLDANGVGEAKSSLITNVAIDATAQTLALDGYAAAPTLLKVTR